MMDDEQRDFLPKLQVGEAIVFCGGWHGPAHAAIRNDLAQTDNNDQSALDISAYGAQQLWHERTRYYPQFCRLSWLSAEGDDPHSFARFVRETRQAQKQLLRLIAQDAKPVHAEAAFARIKQWHTTWQSQVQQVPLADAWVALLQDANPRPHADKQDKYWEIGDSTKIAIIHLMELLTHSSNFLGWKKNKTSLKINNQSGFRELDTHIINLSNFKSF